MKKLQVFILFLFTILPRQVQAEHFPEPPELQNQVEFWKLIYSKYTTNQGLIHDYEDLSIIYTSVDLEDEDSKTSRKNVVSRAKDRYERILLSIVYKNKQDLTEEEERVLKLFKDDTSSSRLLRARNNIRFQLGQKDRFIDGIKRSGRYMNRIQEIFKSQGLPVELSYLPNVESSFNTYAYSKFGAAGLWQFIRSTGKLYLSISDTIDERLDPFLASAAAAKLLQKNYDVLGTWPLALTAYNHGLEGMKRAVAKLGTTDIVTIINEYDGRIFGFASRNFYTEFLAAKYVYENFKSYFGDIELDKPLSYTTLVMRDFIDMDVLIKHLKLDPNEVKEYNPEIRPSVYRGEKRLPKNVVLKVPIKEGVSYGALYASIPTTYKIARQRASSTYRVKRGDSLSTIARYFKTSIRTIQDLNHIRPGSHIYIGQILKLPSYDVAHLEKMTTSEKLLAYASTTVPEKVIEKEVPEEIKTSYTQKATLTENVPPRKTEVVEKKAPPKKTIQEKPRFPLETIYVLSDETLGHFAEWLKVPTSSLRRLNALRGRNIHLGQKIKVIYQNVTKESFEEQRNEYHTGIQDDFWNNYKVTSTKTYRVQKGQSIWNLAYDIHEIPIWLIQQYNPDTDLSKLNAGQSLAIPVVNSKDATPTSKARKNKK